MEMDILALDRHTNAAGLNRLMGSQSLNLTALINWIYIGNKDINEYFIFLNCEICFHSKDHTLS
jgi:hypothetical protein